MANLEVFNGHELVWVAGRARYACLTCGASCAEDNKEALLKRPCSDAALLGLKVLLEAKAGGHVPVVAFCGEERYPLVMCTRCGCYAEVKANGRLTENCSGKASKGSAHRRARVMKGKHPKREEFVDGPWAEMPAAELTRSLAATGPPNTEARQKRPATQDHDEGTPAVKRRTACEHAAGRVPLLEVDEMAFEEEPAGEAASEAPLELKAPPGPSGATA